MKNYPFYSHCLKKFYHLFKNQHRTWKRFSIISSYLQPAAGFLSNLECTLCMLNGNSLRHRTGYPLHTHVRFRIWPHWWLQFLVRLVLPFTFFTWSQKSLYRKLLDFILSLLREKIRMYLLRKLKCKTWMPIENFMQGQVGELESPEAGKPQ